MKQMVPFSIKEMKDLSPVVTEHDSSKGEILVDSLAYSNDEMNSKYSHLFFQQPKYLFFLILSNLQSDN